MLDAETGEVIGGVVSDAIKILGPAALTALVAVKVAGRQLQVERMKLHDRERTEAHQKLFILARRIQATTFPLAEEKYTDFKDAMENSYYNADLEKGTVFFSDEVVEILERFDDMYSCMHMPELQDVKESEIDRFLETEVFAKAEKLASHARAGVSDLRPKE